MSGFVSALLSPFLGRVPAFESVGADWGVQHPTTTVPAEVEPPSDEAGSQFPAVSCASLGRDCPHYATVLRLEAENGFLRTEVMRLEAEAIKPHSPRWAAS